MNGTTAPEVTPGPVPAELVAVTVTRYVVPLFKVESTQVKAPVVVQMAPPGLAVAVYPVMVKPPLENGTAHETTIWALPGVAVRPVGAVGRPTGMTALEGAEAGPVPTAFVAVTVKV